MVARIYYRTYWGPDRMSRLGFYYFKSSHLNLFIHFLLISFSNKLLSKTIFSKQSLILQRSKLQQLVENLQFSRFGEYLMAKSISIDILQCSQFSKFLTLWWSANGSWSTSSGWQVHATEPLASLLVLGLHVNYAITELTDSSRGQLYAVCRSME